MRGTEIARMNFGEFERWVQEKGLVHWRGREAIGDSIISFAYAGYKYSNLAEYKCDNVRVWKMRNEQRTTS